MKIGRFLYLFGLLLMLYSCGSSSVSDATQAYMYQEGSIVLQPVFSFFRAHSDSTEVRFAIDRSQLLYIKRPGKNDFRARIHLHYTLYDGYDQMTLLDSGSVFYSDLKQAEAGGAIFSSFNIAQSAIPERQLLRIEVEDLNRKFKTTYDEWLQVGDPQDRMNFQLKHLEGPYLFKPWVRKEKLYLLDYAVNPDTLLYVRYYKRDFPIAKPPFAEDESDPFDFTEDSLYMVRASDTLFFNRQGLYHFQLDTSSMSGFTVFHFPGEYPFVTRNKDLAPPMRYITNRQEYNKLISTSNSDSLKYLADLFWLERAKDVERGQDAINEFYTRVEQCNRLFTSYLEGWKTDRGIIYIIYGPPSQVFRSDYGESWVYGDGNSSLSYTFNFYHINNPFSSQDMIMDRNPQYRYGWGQAIATWRTGRAYGVKDIRREQAARDAQVRQTRQNPYFWY
jgi:GWxTD domain-containing protein